VWHRHQSQSQWPSEILYTALICKVCQSNITEAKNSIQKYGVLQEYTNPGHKVVMAIKCFMVVPSICGSSVSNMLHIISLVS
jgi:hypothetical protein